MGLINTIAGPLADRLAGLSLGAAVASGLLAIIVLAVALNILNQLLFRDPLQPPVVFHWFPFIGSTVTYGIDPYKFFFSCREQYGDCFTFILLGRRTTVYVGTKGNDFILNAKLDHVNAEDIYSPLTTPVFGKDVVYDCPHAKLMEQKAFVKYGLSEAAFQSYVPLITAETQTFLRASKWFQGEAGTLDVPHAVAELTIYTASRSLQGKEVRSKFDSTFADLYHDLDMGFTPINFMLPWAPLPQNRRRDYANRKMTETYLEIIKERRALQAQGNELEAGREEDMIWNLMRCVYKNGKKIPDHEIAHMMIALLMAGQHSSSATATWILLRLAQNPQITEELLQEQIDVLGADLPPLTYHNLNKLTLNSQVVKETLRIHAPIHSIMRKVMEPMPVKGTNWVVPQGHVLLAAPGVTSNSSEHFPQPDKWDPHRWDPSPNANGSSATRQAKDEDEEEKIDYGWGLVGKGTNSPYLPFGAGRHRCIGEKFAYLQLGAIIATMVREIKVRNLTGKEDEIVGTDYSSLFSKPLAPAMVEWERRSRTKGE